MLQLIGCTDLGATFNNSFSYTFTASGGTAPYTFTITSNDIPGDWNSSLDSGTGIFTTTPLSAGSYTFQVTVTDNVAATDVLNIALHSGKLNYDTGTAYEFSIPINQSTSDPVVITNGVGTINFSSLAGAMSAGTSISYPFTADPTKVGLSGTPTQLGKFTETVELDQVTTEDYIWTTGTDTGSGNKYILKFDPNALTLITSNQIIDSDSSTLPILVGDKFWVGTGIIDPWTLHSYSFPNYASNTSSRSIVIGNEIWEVQGNPTGQILVHDSTTGVITNTLTHADGHTHIFYDIIQVGSSVYVADVRTTGNNFYIEQWDIGTKTFVGEVLLLASAYDGGHSHLGGPYLTTDGSTLWAFVSYGVGADTASFNNLYVLDTSLSITHTYNSLPNVAFAVGSPPNRRPFLINNNGYLYLLATDNLYQINTAGYTVTNSISFTKEIDYLQQGGTLISTHLDLFNKPTKISQTTLSTLTVNFTNTINPGGINSPLSRLAFSSLAPKGFLTFSPTITCPAISVTPGALPDTTVGTAYSQTVSGSGGTGPYTFAVIAGALPTGLTLHTSTGIIDGTPTASGTFSFTIEATDSLGCTGSQAYVGVNSNCPTITQLPASLPVGTINVFYTQTISGSGGTAPYTFTVVSGSLPTGITLDTGTGILSGTPTVAGVFTFDIVSTDNYGCTGTV